MIDRDEIERRTRDRAYRIWVEEGQPEGKYLEHWQRAAREVEEELSMTKGTEDFVKPSEAPAAQKNRE